MCYVLWHKCIEYKAVRCILTQKYSNKLVIPQIWTLLTQRCTAYTFPLTDVKLRTLGSLITIEGLGIWEYFSSSSRLPSDSSSSSSELLEPLRLGGGDTKQRPSSASCRWQMEFELVPFTFLVVVEQVEIQLRVLWGCSCCCSRRLLGRAAGWDVTGAASGNPWLSLLRVEMFGSWAVAGSVLTSLGLPKHWPSEEQCSPCMLGGSNMSKRNCKTSPNCTDIGWSFTVCGTTSDS